MTLADDLESGNRSTDAIGGIGNPWHAHCGRIKVVIEVHRILNHAPATKNNRLILNNFLTWRVEGA